MNANQFTKHKAFMEAKKKIIAEIKDGKFTGIITSDNKIAGWLVEFYAKKDSPLKVIQLGAGVKRLIFADEICETCKGKGYLKKG